MAQLLTKIEKQSTLWKKIEEHFQTRLANHRSENDNDMTDDKTAVLRGRIREDKYILSLGKDETDIDQPDYDYVDIAPGE